MIDRQRLADYRLFFQECRRSFYTTGAIAPSAPALCEALARYAAWPRRSGRALRILEVGAGTGAVTRNVVAGMGPEDTLDIVEINPRFVRALQGLIESDVGLRAARDRIRIHHGAVERFAGLERYDVVISGLPLNNFPVDSVQQILRALGGLASPHGTVSFFQYIGARQVRRLVGDAAERRRVSKVGALLSWTLADFEVAREHVWKNLPPASVHHLRFGADATQVPSTSVALVGSQTPKGCPNCAADYPSRQQASRIIALELAPSARIRLTERSTVGGSA